MSLKRIVSILIALLNAILFVGLFLPFSGDNNVLKATAPFSYIILGFAVLGMLTCILNKKVELNYLTSGGIITLYVATLIGTIQNGLNINSLKIGFYAYLIAGVLILIFTFVQSCLSVSPSKVKVDKKKEIKQGQGNPTTNTNGVVQQTNSLNMNMPVNNFQSLPINQVEKEKAPMDLLLSPQPAGQNLITSHMNELGLHSVNISENNLNGVDPNAAAPVPVAGVEVPITNEPQQIPSAFPTNITQAPPVVGQPPIVGQPPVAGQPPVDAQPQVPPMAGQVGMPPMGGQVGVPQMGAQVPAQPRPDLLAGSQMSGQMDNSPFNPVAPQGPGQFL
jgi:hypothetical protein